jgi:hypothetical protein
MVGQRRDRGILLLQGVEIFSCDTFEAFTERNARQNRAGGR